MYQPHAESGIAQPVGPAISNPAFKHSGTMLEMSGLGKLLFKMVCSDKAAKSSPPRVVRQDKICPSFPTATNFVWEPGRTAVNGGFTFKSFIKPNSSVSSPRIMSISFKLARFLKSVLFFTPGINVMGTDTTSESRTVFACSFRHKGVAGAVTWGTSQSPQLRGNHAGGKNRTDILLF